MTIPYERIIHLIEEHVRYQEEDPGTSGLIKFARALEVEIAGRTCAGCKHLVDGFNARGPECANLDVTNGAKGKMFVPPADFGCNCWTPK